MEFHKSFFETDYSLKDNKDYKQYIKKEIILHGFPNIKEQSYSYQIIENITYAKANIKNNNNKNINALFMLYKASTQSGSSGSPIIIRETENVIGVYNSKGDYEIQGYSAKFNRGNFLINLLKDKERIQRKNFIKEKFITQKKFLIKKSFDCLQFNFKYGQLKVKVIEDKIDNCYYIHCIFIDSLTNEKYHKRKK